MIKPIIYFYLLSLSFQSLNQEEFSIWKSESQEAGTISLTNTSDMFYWYFRSRTSPQSDPLIIWLSGGPGCSSEYALFIENGPFKVIEDNLTLQKNHFSWNNNSNIIYVDNPVGTGFSNSTFDKIPKNQSSVSKDFYQFFIKLLEIYPELKKKPLFITGESYSGQFIPEISSYFLKMKNPNINLQGFAIGNGWVDPMSQYPEYSNFAYENKLINKTILYKQNIQFLLCQKLIQKQAQNSTYFEKATDLCDEGVQTIQKSSSNFNIYDIRLSCINDTYCYNYTYLERFINQKQFNKLLNVSGRDWKLCSESVFQALSSEQLKSQLNNIQFLLENNIRGLIYTGEYDFACNYRGTEAWLKNLRWKNQKTFWNSPQVNWKLGGTQMIVGQLKSYENLSYIKVLNSGHMVPMDQPAVAQFMINQFIQNRLNKN